MLVRKSITFTLHSSSNNGAAYFVSEEVPTMEKRTIHDWSHLIASVLGVITVLELAMYLGGNFLMKHSGLIIIDIMKILQWFWNRILDVE